MRGRRRFRIGRAKAILFGAVILLATAGVVRSCWDSVHSPRAGVRRMLRRIPGVEFGRIRADNGNGVAIADLAWSENGITLFSAEEVRLTLVPEREGELRSILCGGVVLRQLPVLLKSLQTDGLPGRIAAEEIALAGVWIGENGRKYPFTLQSIREEKDGVRSVKIVLPETGFQVTGEFRAAEGSWQLRFSGHLDAAMLAAAGVPMPKEVRVPGRFTVSGSVRLGPEHLRFTEPLTADGLFPEPAMIEGGFWRLTPGGCYSFRWEGPGKHWSITLPEAELQLPFVAPLGALTVSGDGGRELRFSLSTATPAGKQSGNLRLDGRIDRQNGAWELRQSGSSDRVMNWQWETPLGLVSCLWRNPKLSGAGVGARGEIDYAFGFDQFRFRPVAEQTSFSALPGTISGSWNFDFTAPAVSSFTLTGKLDTAKLEWPEPRSAWGAARARIGFALSRLPGEPAWKLDLEPEAAGVNVFGAELPKLKLENLSGRFSTSLAAGRPDRRPGEIAGGIQIGRVAVVDSAFGSGSLEEFRLTGVVELDDEGRVASHRLSAGCGRGTLRNGRAELSAAGAELDCDFSRRQITPGDNLISNVALEKPVLNLFGSTWSAPRGEFRVSGEIRGTELLPSGWNAHFQLPGGTMKTGNFTGTFRGFSGDARWLAGEPAALAMSLSGVAGSWSEAVGRPGWSLEAPVVALSLARKEGNFSGEASLKDGSLTVQLGEGVPLAVKRLSATVPIHFPQSGEGPSGRFSAEGIQMPGEWIHAAGGVLRLGGSGLTFQGRASSPYLEGEPLEFQGGIGAGTPFAGSFRLNPTPLIRPLQFDAPSAFQGECRYTGKLAASGSFGGRGGWQLAFQPSEGRLTAGGFAWEGLEGTLRLGEFETRRQNSGGEFSFRRMSGHGVTMHQGWLRFRLPQSGEFNLIGAGGVLWGGRARLEAPVLLAPGMGAVEAGVRLRGVRIGQLMEALKLPAAPISGVASGRAVWRILPGAAPELVSADFSSDRVDYLRLGALEPFLLNQAGDSPRTRRIIEILRDFNCRNLQLKIDREESGKGTLELVVTGRPTRPIAVTDHAIQRYVDAIDPASLGLDSDMTVSITYRLPEQEGN